MVAPSLDQQMSLERSLFLPGMTVQAMRDNRYRHPANAVAELIDNSIDARARHVDLLVLEAQTIVNTRRRWVVSELAVIDDGHAMSDETLIQALRFGGRRDHGNVQNIGKYGMGLPTASISQCRRVDVWTWQRGIDNPSHTYLDVDAIETGEQYEIPTPDNDPVPEHWRDTVRRETRTAMSGTLVVWSNIDRIRTQSETIFARIEKEIGRIYRHFINDNELSIRMASFRSGQSIPLGQNDSDRLVRPNDPLFLMTNSSTSDPWNDEPMFKTTHQKSYELDIDGRRENVDITYSIVKEAALGTQAAQPGSLPHGQDARNNMGVSIVRENREILVDNSFVREGGRGSIPMNRWWGCEVRFNQGCDDAFGIDHNKQMVVIFSNAARELLNSEYDDTSDILERLGAADDPVYRIVADIRDTTRSMLRDIELMFRRRRQMRLHETEEESSAEDEASRLATQSLEDRLNDRREQMTQTDRDHDHMDEQSRTHSLAEFLSNQGLETEEAAQRAAELVRSNFRFSFNPADLDGYQMFSVKNSSGVLFLNLNINHQLYEFLDFLEEDAEENENPAARRAAIGIRTLLLAWGRMEDHIEDGQRRQEVQQIAYQWGQQASEVLRQLNEQSSG